MWNLNNSGLTRSVWLVRIGDDADTALYRRFHFDCQQGRWRITAIRLSPEETSLSELLDGLP